MPTQVQFRRGTTAQNQNFTGAAGEISIDTSKKTIIVHDGSTPGGFPVAPNSAFDIANAAFSYANSVGTQESAAFAVANAAFGLTNNTYAATNSVFGVANAAFNSANNVAPQVAPAFNTANASYGVANVGYAAVNSAFGVINAAFGIANNAYTATNGAAAFAFANGVSTNTTAAFAFANGVSTNTTAAFGLTNSTYAAVNSAFGVANAAYTQVNTLSTSANAYSAVVGTSANAYSNATFVKLTATSQTITGDLAITGNLTFLGNSTIISSNNLVVGDSLIYLAANNYSGTDLLDIGFVANYGNTTGANVHTGLVRDATNKQYYLFNGYDVEPANNNFVPGGNNMVNAVLVADFNTSNLTLGGANAITWITSNYGVSNAAFGLTNTTYAAVNSAFGVINAAFTQSNTDNVRLSAAYVSQNAGYVVANAAFGAANGKVASVTGTAGQIFSSGTTTPTLNLISTGVTATTYGGATQIPVITVDAYGRLTSAANAAVQGMDYAYANTIWGVANAGFTVANAAFAKANAAATAASPTFTGTVTFNANMSNQTLTDGATINWDVSIGAVATVTLGGARTMAAPTNLKVGTYILHVVQDATGSRTITWNSVFKWPAATAPTLTTTANARDIFSFICDGTNLYGTYVPDVR